MRCGVGEKVARNVVNVVHDDGVLPRDAKCVWVIVFGLFALFVYAESERSHYVDELFTAIGRIEVEVMGDFPRDG